MVLRRVFSVHLPEHGPFQPDQVVSSEPKQIVVRGKAIDGWIVTLRSDEDQVHLAFESIDDGE